jgi:hypothetical protein
VRDVRVVDVLTFALNLTAAVIEPDCDVLNWVQNPENASKILNTRASAKLGVLVPV